MPSKSLILSLLSFDWLSIINVLGRRKPANFFIRKLLAQLKAYIRFAGAGGMNNRSLACFGKHIKDRIKRGLVVLKQLNTYVQFLPPACYIIYCNKVVNLMIA